MIPTDQATIVDDMYEVIDGREKRVWFRPMLCEMFDDDDSDDDSIDSYQPVISDPEQQSAFSMNPSPVLTPCIDWDEACERTNVQFQPLPKRQKLHTIEEKGEGKEVVGWYVDRNPRKDDFIIEAAENEDFEEMPAFEGVESDEVLDDLENSSLTL